MYTPTRLEVEKRNRIRLCVFAYAYEIEMASIISDAEYDTLSNSIDVLISVDAFDYFWLKHFEPDTSMWIHKHPNLDGIRWIYNKFYKATL